MMTKEEEIRINQQIARFVGLAPDEDGVYIDSHETMVFFPELGCNRLAKELAFHRNWNWIMRAVKKIITSPVPENQSEGSHLYYALSDTFWYCDIRKTHKVLVGLWTGILKTKSNGSNTTGTERT